MLTCETRECVVGHLQRGEVAVKPMPSFVVAWATYCAVALPSSTYGSGRITIQPTLPLGTSQCLNQVLPQIL